MVEEFRPVKDYERYYVSDLGRVLNTETGKFLKMLEMSNGYFCVNLYKNRKSKKHLVHRLVAQAFIPNPDNLDTVDHLNGQKSDNRVCNLRWLSRSENVSRFHKEQQTEEQIEHYKTVHRESIKKAQEKAHEVIKKPIICTDTGKIYESATQASKELNLFVTNIVKVCKGKRKHTKGYHFEYLLKE